MTKLINQKQKLVLTSLNMKNQDVGWENDVVR